MFTSKDFSHLSNHHKRYFRVAASTMVVELILMAVAFFVMLAGFGGYVSITAWFAPMWAMVAILVIFGIYTFAQQLATLRDPQQQQVQGCPQVK